MASAMVTLTPEFSPPESRNSGMIFSCVRQTQLARLIAISPSRHLAISQDRHLARSQDRKIACTQNERVRSLDKAHRAAKRIQTGYVWINNSSQHFIGALFGGLKSSGVGREECFAELLEFTYTKNVNLKFVS